MSVTSSSSSQTNPLRAARDRVGQRGDEATHLRSNVAQHENRVLRTRVRDDIRQLDSIEIDPGNESALHQHGIGGGIRAQTVKARLTIKISIGGIDRTGELVVEETAAIVEPLRLGGLGVGDAIGQVVAVGDVKHMQGRILTAVLGQAVDHMPPVRRRAPPIQRHMALWAARLRGIDQHSVVAGRAFAHEQLEVIGAEGPLRKESHPAGSLHTAGHHRIAR